MNKLLPKNLLVFSDGSISLEFTKYTNKKIKCLNKDFKLHQVNNKQQFSSDFYKTTHLSNFRKNLFK